MKGNNASLCELLMFSTFLALVCTYLLSPRVSPFCFPPFFLLVKRRTLSSLLLFDFTLVSLILLFTQPESKQQNHTRPLTAVHMFTAKSTALYALVACLVLLCGAPCTLPAAAQGDAANPSRTFRFLQEFPKTIPQLRSLWTGTDYCSWSGVSCDDASAGTGVSITLGSRSYSGVTPDVPSGDGDVNVIQIDLAWNRGIRGRFRESWSALSQLTFLGLAGTSMYGDIPDAWNAMHALTFVDFRYTGACRSLPNWNFSSMPLLEYASFSETDLNLLSSSFGTFSASTRLQTFRLGGNRFCFCLPDTWTSALLRNTALDATRALGDPDCATKNSCTSSEVGACKDGFVSFVPSFTPLFTVVVGLLLFLC